MDTDLNKWDEKQIKDGASFLQSKPWGDFQQTVGFKPHYLSGDGWTCLILEKANSIGKYLFAPYGPTLENPAKLNDCLDHLISLAKQVKADWLRLEPIIMNGQLEDLASKLSSNGARRAVHDVNPPLTRILNLSPPVEDILAGISQSTRSLIRKNQREHTLIFKTSTNPDDMAVFNDMLDTVAERNGVAFFSKDYFIKQARVLMPANMLYLEQAYSNNKLVGEAVMHDYGAFGSYTYAASPPEARELSVSALLLWQAIVNAKSRGIKRLDLYGTAPDDAPPSHPKYGFSVLKKKFRGEVVESVGTWDIPITKKYKLYRAARRAQRVIKGR